MYANTRHSVGHLVIEHLRSHFQLYPFANASKLVGSVTRDPSRRLTLFQSASFMNLSGTSVSLAWKDFRKDLSSDELSRARLVVVHDDLENHLGGLKVKVLGKGNGHRGIQSCNAVLNTEDYTRLAIGIGRPSSRSPDVVANYVLGKMRLQEITELENTVIPKVISAIETLQIFQSAASTKLPKNSPSKKEPVSKAADFLTTVADH